MSKDLLVERQRNLPLLAIGGASSPAGGFIFITNVCHTLEVPPAHVALRRGGEIPDR